MDHCGTAGEFPGLRFGDRDVLPDGRIVPAAGTRQFHIARDTTNTNRPCLGSPDPGTRRTRAVDQACLPHLPDRLDPDLHPAGLLLPDRQPGGRNGGNESRPDDVVRPDGRDHLHAHHATVLQAAGCQVDAGRRDAGVGDSLRAVLTGSRRRDQLDDHRRDRAARNLLRLLLCHRPDLHGQGRGRTNPGPGPGTAGAVHARTGNVHRSQGGRRS